MAEHKSITPAATDVGERVQAEIDRALGGEKWKQFARFAMAALGSIPWVGGFLGASAAYHAEKGQAKVNDLHYQWLKEHQEKIDKLKDTLFAIFVRLEQFGDEAKARISDENYLALVRKGFRLWDQADTDEKRDLVKRLLTNAAGTRLCPDDLVRLFLDWIDKYHESHFVIIREIYRHPGITRGQIWDNVRGERPREDSADADLFRLLISDLSTGRVIRQHRETTESGDFLTKRSGRKGSGSGTMKSAFDDAEPYELTQLGGQFVHYAMDEAAPRLEGASADQTQSDSEA